MSETNLSLHVSVVVCGAVCLFLALAPPSTRHHLQTTTNQFNLSQYELELEEKYLLAGIIAGSKKIHRAVNPTEVYDADEAENSINTSRGESERSDGGPTFRKNEPVEIYSPTSKLAFPAIVDSVICDEKYGDTYMMTEYDANSRASLPIQARYVHRYETYPVGTRAMCGRSRGSVRGGKSEVPCLVKSRSIGKSTGFEYADTYEVVYLDGVTSEVIIDHLPFSRVQRYLDQSAFNGSPILEEILNGAVTSMY